MRLFIITVALFCFANPSKADFYSCAQWLELERFARGSYIAGVFDAMTAYSVGLASEPKADHFRECIMNSRMTNIQLSENLVSYIKGKPALQVGSVPNALADYLEAACGDKQGTR